MWSGRPTTSAAATKDARAAAEGPSSRRCATQAAATSAASGGTARAESARCAVWRERTPETTASAAAPAAPTAINLSQGPGRTSGMVDCPPLDASTEITQRAGPRYVGNLVEVVRRRRRARVPLERVGLPGVVPRPPPGPRRLDGVDHEDERRERHHEGPDRRDEIPRRPPAVVVVGPDPARHPEQAEEVLREEGQVDSDEVEPEVDLPEPLVEEPPEHLRPPVVEGPEEGEGRAAEEHVMHVRDDEIRVRDLPVERERREHHTRQPSDREYADGAEREQHRRVEDDVSA